jgi:hypothetical protein
MSEDTNISTIEPEPHPQNEEWLDLVLEEEERRLEEVDDE